MAECEAEQAVHSPFGFILLGFHHRKALIDPSFSKALFAGYWYQSQLFPLLGQSADSPQGGERTTLKGCLLQILHLYSSHSACEFPFRTTSLWLLQDDRLQGNKKQWLLMQTGAWSALRTPVF